MDEGRCCCGSGDAGFGVPKNKLKSIKQIKKMKMADKENKDKEKCSLELALDDIKHGRVTTWNSAEEMFKTLGV